MPMMTYRIASHDAVGDGRLARSQEEVMRELRHLIEDGEALVRSTANLTGDAAAKARERFSARLAAAKVWTSDSSSAALDTGRRAAAATDRYVRAHPWPVFGAATGVGLLVGAMLGRRRS